MRNLNKVLTNLIISYKVNKGSFMNKIFHALLNEAKFTSEMLSAGYNQIGKANFTQKGIYFQAFTSLSTGLERLGKLNIILEFIILNNGDLPRDDYMKHEIGHDLEKIYFLNKEIKNRHNIIANGLQDLESDIYRKILSILSKFGKGDRYSNIDLIINKLNYIDPIISWNKDIDMEIFNKKINKNKKTYIEATSQFLDNILSNDSIVVHNTENGNDISTIYNYNFQSQIYYAVERYRRIYVYQIIRYFVEILFELQRIIKKSNIFNIPHFSEIFYIYYYDENYIKRRKTLI